MWGRGGYVVTSACVRQGGPMAIVWWEIESPDPEAFQQFHAALWGWTFVPAFVGTELGADYWIIQDDGRGVGGLQRAAAGAPPPQVGARLYVEVTDLEAALVEVRRRGGRVERGRTELGGDDRWFATVVDPTGVSFGLWTAEPASDAASGRATV